MRKNGTSQLTKTEDKASATVRNTILYSAETAPEVVITSNQRTIQMIRTVNMKIIENKPSKEDRKSREYSSTMTISEKRATKKKRSL